VSVKTSATRFHADDGRLLASVIRMGNYRVRLYGPDEQVIEYSEWATRDAAFNVARRYART
jgi:hypothetical protein